MFFLTLLFFSFIVQTMLKKMHFSFPKKKKYITFPTNILAVDNNNCLLRDKSE